MKTLLFTFILTIILTFQIFSQDYLQKTLQTYQNPEELVTLSSTVPFSQAIDLLSKVSEKITGKPIVSNVEIDTSIGIEIKNMNYYKAMVVLVKMAGLVYEEKPDVIIIKKSSSLTQERTKDNYVPANTPEVKISAIFFEADVNKERQLGINWQSVFQNATSNIGGTLNSFAPNPTSTSSTGGTTGGTTGSTGSTGGTSTQITPDFNISASTNYSVGGFSGQVAALFKFFENENLGEIISSPTITVLNGTEARLQDGQDISIKQRDFSGNIIDNFYSTGSIVTVTPHIITEDGLKYILLKIHVERSSFVPDPTTTIINKTSADTRVTMLNGEETVIGGMYIDQTTKIRRGVPFLKDLPWWFFGLRYVFGYDDNAVTKKELVILIRATLEPTLESRLSKPQSVNPLKDELEHQRERIKYYQLNQQQSKDN